jgi:hypothetical protein
MDQEGGTIMTQTAYCSDFPYRSRTGQIGPEAAMEMLRKELEQEHFGTMRPLDSILNDLMEVCAAWEK